MWSYFASAPTCVPACMPGLRRAGTACRRPVAALIGNVDPQDAIAEGRRRLRAISCALLEADVFTDAAPSERWTCKAVHAELDSIDAFVSHSWHDDPAAKWVALQEWRAEFVERNRREPLVWIDRCCILVSEGDLRSLPIFLSGCRKLLIIAGPTFLNRLWYVVELFVFEQMHPFDFRTASNATLSSHVELRPLPGCDLAGFERFSVADAVCCVPDDGDRLRACIEISCGSIEDFNARTRQLLWRLRTLWVSENLSSAAGAMMLARSPRSPRRPHWLGARAGVSVRVTPLAHAEAPAEAAAPRRSGQRNGCWCLLGLVAVLMVIYGLIFAAYASRLSVPIIADCAACTDELRVLSLDAHGWMYESEQAGELRSGKSYRYSGSRAHVTRALSAIAAAEMCAREGGQLAVPRSAAEVRRLNCIVGSDSYGVWIGVDPSAREVGAYITGSVVTGAQSGQRATEMCVPKVSWGWMTSECASRYHYICERG
ncbi:hypothetical protein T492DRAFT_944734 [Pavlovales sp. CCMP2436]|nr:hypothetical protein T492DRAFT_944734 [Pavlovales sp. CCMP2436]